MLYTRVALKQPSSIAHTRTTGKRWKQQPRLAAAPAHSTSLITSLWVMQCKVTTARVSWGEAKQEGRKLILRCWKQKLMFTVSLANFSKSLWETEKRWWTADTGQQHCPHSHRMCKSLFYVCMFILEHTQAASASDWTQTRGHSSMYWVPPLVPKAT